jgi:predicted metal-dependent peptidase
MMYGSLSISFDSAVYPVDLWAKPPRIRGGGATSFDAVERFAGQLDRYPDLIITMTGGQTPRPTVRHPDRWFWLITDGGTTSAIEGIGRHCLIGGSS